MIIKNKPASIVDQGSNQPIRI